jgi:hypothetical protein
MLRRRGGTITQLPATLELTIEAAIMRHPSQGSSGESHPEEQSRVVAAEGATRPETLRHRNGEI